MYVESLPANTGHAELYEEFREHFARVSEDVEKRLPKHSGDEHSDKDVEPRKKRPRFRWM